MNKVCSSSSVYECTEALGDYLRSVQESERAGVIALDGFHGIGKSNAARKLSVLLDVPAVHGDLFIHEDQSKLYPEILNLKCVGKVLRTATESGRVVIFESVHALSILQALNLTPLEHVYVKHFWPAGVATHAGALGSEQALRSCIESEEEEHRSQGLDPDSEPSLLLELMRYHLIFQPHRRCTLELHHTFAPQQ
jgi:hypothetical protein